MLFQRNRKLGHESLSFLMKSKKEKQANPVPVATFITTPNLFSFK